MTVAWRATCRGVEAGAALMATLRGPAAPGDRRQGGQAARQRAGAADRRRPAAALPAPVRDRGELTDLASLRDDEYVTVQAEIAAVTSRPMRNRQGHIFEAIVTDGHGQLVLTFFSRGAGLARARARARAARPLLRPGLQLPRQAPARPPRLRAARRRATALRTGPPSSPREIIPVYPASQGDHLLADRRLGAGRPGRPGRRGPDAALDREPHGLSARPTPARHPPADRLRRQGARHGPAEVGRGVPAAGRCSRSGGWPPRRCRDAAAARAGGLLAAFDARLPFALTDGQRAGRRPRSATSWPSTTRCTGCCRARSAPARPSSRCARCCRSSTPAGRRRCSRRPRCSPSSTTARSPRCSARWPRPASSAAPSTPPGWRC